MTRRTASSSSTTSTRARALLPVPSISSASVNGAGPVGRELARGRAGRCPGPRTISLVSTVKVPPTDRSQDVAVVSLNVLVVGTDDWAIDQAVAALTARGHTALTCHRSGEPAFPCNALLPGRTCPLDVGFSVVVTVRARASHLPAAAEFGVTCGLHAGADLVVAGVSAQNPFGQWSTRTVEVGGDLATECERAARASGRWSPEGMTFDSAASVSGSPMRQEP